MIWRVVGVRGRVLYAAGFEWSTGNLAHLVSDIREQRQVVNGRQSATWGEVVLRTVLVHGFVAWGEAEPEWWNVTEAEARRRVGLPPRPAGGGE